MSGARVTSMAKKRGRPKSQSPRGDGLQVRIDPQIVGRARLIAGNRGIGVSEYVSALLDGPVAKDYAKLIREMEAEGGSN